MATLYITELRSLAFDPHGNAVMAGQMPGVTEQSIAISGVSGQSSAFGALTRYVMLNCDTACCLAWGSNPTAVDTAQRMGANETRFYGVNPGDMLAVIVST